MVFDNSKVNFREELEIDNRSIRKLWISPAKDAAIKTISERNPTLLVSNGNAIYLDGVPRPEVSFFQG